MKNKRKRLFILILSFILILGFLAFFGDNGIFHLVSLQKELVRIADINSKAAQENQGLKEEVKRLQSDKRYIEAIARRELGMAKKGEIIYQFDLPVADKRVSK